MAHDERAISELLDSVTQALFEKDAAGAIAPLADDAVTFDLAPPLKHGPAITHDPARLEEWFGTWKGPIISQPGERTIVVDENVAYAYGLQRMTGTKTDGEKVELWFRATACFRRDDGQWRITHMHNSVPFAMDGSDKALLNLKP
jgi:ketosteroid isomerase-like protein